MGFLLFPTPSVTVATAERSFLELVKNHLRSPMGQGTASRDVLLSTVRDNGHTTGTLNSYY